MTSDSEDVHIDYPPVANLESKLRVLAYLVTFCLHYFDCDVDSTTTMLAYYGLGHLVGWAVQRLKDDGIVDRLREQGRGKDIFVVHFVKTRLLAGTENTGFLDGIENTRVSITHLHASPKAINIKCRELLDFASKGDPLIARTASGRQISMCILSGSIFCYDLD